MSECKVMLSQAKKIWDAFTNQGHKTPGFQKRYGTQKELNVVIEDAVKKALKKAQDTSSGNASSEELEVFNASNDFCMLKIDSGKEDSHRAWHPQSHFPSDETYDHSLI